MFWKKKKEKNHLQDNTASPLQEYFDAYLKWAKAPTNIEQVMDVKLLLQDKVFARFFQQAMEEKEAALQLVADALEEMDLFQACIAAHLCGALIESVGAEQNGRQIVEVFDRIVFLSCAYLNDAKEQLGLADDVFEPMDMEKVDLQLLFVQNPERFRAYFGCDLLTLALMAVITRNHEARIALRQKGLYQHMQYLQQFKDSIHYVLEVHDACAMLAVTVLAPAAEMGFRILLNDVSNCFHMFTLLEAELYRKKWLERLQIKDYIWNERIYQIAAGAQYPKQEDSIFAHQQYYTSYALQPDGSYKILMETAKGQQINPDALVWGEMPPEAIPVLDGERIVLVDQQGMFAGRSWDVSFISKCHDALNPFLKITEELSVEEYTALMEKMKKR